ncbi:hypothetical protein PAE4_40277 [Bacillus altitudinis]|nr:hypothetical protein PAE4_40277 [Bacillus altitudinis]
MIGENKQRQSAFDYEPPCSFRRLCYLSDHSDFSFFLKIKLSCAIVC